MRTMRGMSWKLALVGLLAFAAAPAWAQDADLAVTKTGPATAAVGSNVAYTVTVQNNGPDDAGAAQLTDNMPAGMTFVSISQDTGPTFSCVTPSVGANGAIVCTIATFTNGSSATFTITMGIPNGTAPGTVFVNMASVFSSTPDSNSENDTSAAGTQVPGATADVGIAKSGPASVSPGSNITYTITLNNAGPNDATTVSWTDTLPGTLTFVSFNQTSGPTFNCGSPSTTVTCTLATFPAGSTATFQYVANVPAATPNGTSFVNTASVTSDDDPNPENDTSTTTTVVGSADLGVTKSGPASAVAGSTYDYVITVTNSGPSLANSPHFDDTLPAGLTFVALVQNTGPAAAACVAPPVGSGGTVSCSWNALLNGQTATFTITVAVDNNTANATVITNTATVASSTVDPNPGNDSASAQTTISAQADLAVSKTGGSSAAAGSNVSYTLTVNNVGPSGASGVSLSDTLPPGETFVSITQTAGPTFNCTGGATVTCSAATLASATSATFTLVAAVGSGVANGTILSNTATVTSTTPDPTPGNNSSTATTTVQATADLSLTKTGPATVVAGGNLTYTLTLSNAGPSAASTVTLTDTLPAGETFLALTQSAGPLFACTTPPVGSGGTITCTLASLAANASATFSLTVATSASPGSNLVNTASATSTTADANGGNNAATAGVAVVAAAPPEATPTLDARRLLLLIALVGVLGAFASRRARRG